MENEYIEKDNDLQTIPQVNPFKEQRKLQVMKENLESELNIAPEYKGKFSLDSLVKMKQEKDKNKNTSFKKDARTKSQQEYGQIRAQQIANAEKQMKAYEKSGFENAIRYIPIISSYSKIGQADLLEQAGRKDEAEAMRTAAGVSAGLDLLTLGTGLKYPLPTVYGITGSAVGGNVGRIIGGNEGELTGSIIGGIGGATLPGLYNSIQHALLRHTFNKELNRASSNIKPPVINVEPITITNPQVPKQDNLLTLKNLSDINRIASIKSNISEAERIGIPKGERNQRVVRRKWKNDPLSEKEIWRNDPDTPVGAIQLSDDLSDIATPFDKYYVLDDVESITRGFPSRFREFKGNSIYDDIFQKLGDQLAYVHPSISAKGSLEENPMIWDYRRYLLNQGIPSENISTETLEKILSQQYQQLTNTMTGKAKGLVLWNGSPNWFDKFDYENNLGNVSHNMGNAGAGTYFSRGRQSYGLSDQSGYVPYESSVTMLPFQLNWNIQPYLITDIKSMPHYNQIEHIPENMMNRSIDYVRTLKPNNQLVINTFGGMRHPTLQPTKFQTNSNLGDQIEFRLRRNTGIKSLFPHPSTFVTNEDGTISIIRDWNDPRVNFKQGGKLKTKN